MWVKPTDDSTRAIVIDPVSRAKLPEEGMEVPDHDTYWLRRLSQGDVEKIESPSNSSSVTSGGSAGTSTARVTSGGTATPITSGGSGA